MQRISRILKSCIGPGSLLVALLAIGCDKGQVPPNASTSDPVPSQASGIDSVLEAKRTSDASIDSLFQANASDVQVLVRGTVTKFLADDVEGDKHQRLILKLASGKTLLIAHNIDLAGRVPNTALNKIVYANGDYEWNSEGGVVHWTHKDPDNVHAAGWIQFDGDRYW